MQLRALYTRTHAYFRTPRVLSYASKIAYKTYEMSRLLAAVVLLLQLLQINALNAIKELRVGTWLGAPFNMANGTGYESEIMTSACAILDIQCTPFIELPTLDDRLSALLNGTADITFGQFTVSDERSEKVLFVHPYIYSSGAALSTTIENAAKVTNLGWEGLKDKPVCTLNNWYAAPLLKLLFGMRFVFKQDFEGIKSGVQSGECIAGAGDSTSYLGLPYLNLPLQVPGPYAFAVAKNNTELAAVIGGAVTRLMGAGFSSELLKLEEKYLVPEGISKNGDLVGVISAISNFSVISRPEDAQCLKESSGALMAAAPLGSMLWAILVALYAILLIH